MSIASLSAPGSPSSVSFNPAGTQLAVGSESGAVDVFNPRTERREFSLPVAASGVSSVTYSPDGRYLVTVLLDGSAEVWAARSPQLQRVDEGSALLTPPVFEAAGGDFATGDASGTAKIWTECPACGDPTLLLGLAREQIARA